MQERKNLSRVLLGRRLLGFGMVAVVLLSIALWFVTRETLPEKIRIAAAVRGGLYFKLGETLRPHLAKRSRRPVKVIETEGTLENQELLRSGAVELAVFQAGAGDLDGLLAIAPLYHDVLHVIVRRGGDYRTLRGLFGTPIAIGPRRSGMLESARDVLEHYEIADTVRENLYFLEMMDDPSIGAAFVTTGLLNPDLLRLLKSGEFDLLEVGDADALAILHPHFQTFTIPRGLFNERPPSPSKDIGTLATTSFLAVRSEAPGVLVRAVLDSLYGNDLRQTIPTLLTRSEAAAWNDLPLHPEASSFFKPYSGLEVLANFMESLAALKELLFALGAGLYLIFMRWQRLKEKELESTLHEGKERLDVFLEKTIEIERRLSEIDDPESLRRCLEEVTSLKLAALEELTHEGLRGDVTFAIFLQQCGDVIRRIQTKLQLLRQEKEHPSRRLAAALPDEVDHA